MHAPITSRLPISCRCRGGEPRLKFAFRLAAILFVLVYKASSYWQTLPDSLSPAPAGPLASLTAKQVQCAPGKVCHSSAADHHVGTNLYYNVWRPRRAGSLLNSELAGLFEMGPGKGNTHDELESNRRSESHSPLALDWKIIRRMHHTDWIGTLDGIRGQMITLSLFTKSQMLSAYSGPLTISSARDGEDLRALVEEIEANGTALPPPFMATADDVKLFIDSLKTNDLRGQPPGVHTRTLGRSYY